MSVPQVRPGSYHFTCDSYNFQNTNLNSLDLGTATKILLPCCNATYSLSISFPNLLFPRTTSFCSHIYTRAYSEASTGSPRSPGPTLPQSWTSFWHTNIIPVRTTLNRTSMFSSMYIQCLTSAYIFPQILPQNHIYIFETPYQIIRRHIQSPYSQHPPFIMISQVAQMPSEFNR